MNVTRPSLLAALALSAAVVSAAPPEPSPQPPTGHLRVEGAVPHALDLSPADVAALPHHEVTAKDVHGRGGVFEGVDLVEILRRAEAPLGEALRGRHLRDVVRVECADGYVVVFALAELDPGLGARSVLLADSRDGAPLSAEEGPWRLVIPAETRPARWARQVQSIRVVALD